MILELAWTYRKWIGLGLAAAALFGAWSYHKGVVEDRDAAIAKVGSICAVTRTSLGKPKIRCEDVELHINAAAGNLSRCEAALTTQTGKVNQWKREAEMQQERAREAARQADKRAGRAETAAEQFRDAMRDGAVDANCLSPQLEKAWPGAKQ